VEERRYFHVFNLPREYAGTNFDNVSLAYSRTNAAEVPFGLTTARTRLWNDKRGEKGLQSFGCNR
jgi:hypothetical protein